jgi:hypothetical protein
MERAMVNGRARRFVVGTSIKERHQSELRISLEVYKKERKRQNKRSLVLFVPCSSFKLLVKTGLQFPWPVCGPGTASPASLLFPNSLPSAHQTA